MAARGLKSKIAINVAVLLLLSAIVTDGLIIVVVQNIMTRNEVARQRRVLESLGRLYFHGASGPYSASGASREARYLTAFEDGFAAVAVWDRSGKRRFDYHSPGYTLSLPKSRIDAVLKSRKTIVDDVGWTWSIFWWRPTATSLAIPIWKQEQPLGVVAAIVALDPLFDQLRGYHKAILLYILINTCILTIVGLYRIFRLYLSPIDRIVTQADHFNEDDDPFFAFRQEDNELNRLSSSLNRMLARISSDKQKLHQTVSSLEKANKELQAAQREIIQAEKLASVGRLAAGIAHEIGNPIGIVLGYLDLLKHKDLDDDETIDFLQRAEVEVQRINSIIRQLLDLARTKDIKPQAVSLHPVIEEIVQVMGVQPLMADIDIELDFEAQQDMVWGNSDQLRQVFLNLVLNAADAIQSASSPGNGTIRIHTMVQNTEAVGPTHLQITVSDSGPGIEQDQLQNIFDPFFTTKQPGKGTGLGLAVSYMIVDGLGGSISADSIPGQGAVITIFLRLADSNPATGQETDETPPH